MITVCTSGWVDPIHVGHIRLFREARSLGDRLIVILNSDETLLKKKHYFFLPSGERKEIL
jgi:cytidyltransferase-like protein